MTEPITIEPLTEEVIDSQLDRKVMVGALLEEAERNQLVQFLKENQDVFAWSHLDMPGISPEVTCHRLNTDPDFPPYRQ